MKGAQRRRSLQSYKVRSLVTLMNNRHITKKKMTIIHKTLNLTLQKGSSNYSKAQAMLQNQPNLQSLPYHQTLGLEEVKGKRGHPRCRKRKSSTLPLSYIQLGKQALTISPSKLQRPRKGNWKTQLSLQSAAWSFQRHRWIYEIIQRGRLSQEFLQPASSQLCFVFSCFGSPIIFKCPFLWL